MKPKGRSAALELSLDFFYARQKLDQSKDSLDLVWWLCTKAVTGAEIWGLELFRTRYVEHLCSGTKYAMASPGS